MLLTAFQIRLYNQRATKSIPSLGFPNITSYFAKRKARRQKTWA